MIETHNPLPDPCHGRAPADIAQDIRKFMITGGSTWTYCRPYVEAMDVLPTWLDAVPMEVSVIKDAVIFPNMVKGMSGQEIALRFLCNAGAWRGTAARRIKDELRAICGQALGVRT